MLPLKRSMPVSKVRLRPEGKPERIALTVIAQLLQRTYLFTQNTDFGNIFNSSWEIIFLVTSYRIFLTAEFWVHLYKVWRQHNKREVLISAHSRYLPRFERVKIVSGPM